MAMIDALMMAYTVEMISIEKVVASVKRFSTFSASKELPYDLEDAMVFWINKVKFASRAVSVPCAVFTKLLMSAFRPSFLTAPFCHLFYFKELLVIIVLLVPQDCFLLLEANVYLDVFIPMLILSVLCPFR